MRSMNLAPVTQREISQKNISYINIYMKSRKTVLMNLFAGQQWRPRHREQTYGHGRGEEGEDGMYGECNMETYFIVYKIDS